MSTETVKTFTRKATGLVREVSATDALFYNVNFISIGLGLGFVLLYVPWSYPGASIPLAVLLCMLFALPTAYVYGMLSGTMPRSGGEYVYVSRVLGPAWAMVASFNQTLWQLFYIGVPAAMLGRYGLSTFFRVTGVYAGSAGLISLGNWFASTVGSFVGGLGLIALLTLVFIRGLGLYMRLQKYAFALAMLSTVIMFFVLLGASPDQFVAAFNQYMAGISGQADTFRFVLETANSQQLVSPPIPFNWKDTLLAVTWVYLTVGFNQSSAYIGGEVKNAARTQLRTIPGAIVLGGLGMMVLGWLVQRTIGNEFLGALTAVTYTDPSVIGVSAPPVFGELVIMLTRSPILAILMALGFIFWSYTWMPGQILIVSRNLLAYAVDGLVPARLGEVSEKTSTPVFNLVLIGILGAVSMWVYLFTPYFVTLSGIFGFCLVFAVTSLAAILLPYRQKEMYEGSPFTQKVGGLPLLSVVGALSLVAVLVLAYLYYIAPDSGVGVSNMTMFYFNLATFFSGLVVYYVARAVQRSRGVDVDLNFQEIPPE